jgi:hypothetical protein
MSIYVAFHQAGLFRIQVDKMLKTHIHDVEVFYPHLKHAFADDNESICEAIRNDLGKALPGIHRGMCEVCVLQ